MQFDTALQLSINFSAETSDCFSMLCGGDSCPCQQCVHLTRVEQDRQDGIRSGATVGAKHVSVWCLL